MSSCGIVAESRPGDLLGSLVSFQKPVPDVPLSATNLAKYVSLSDVVLVSYQASGGSTNPKRISIRSLVTEINIYESIDSKCLSGNIVVTDAQNIPNHLL